MSNLSEVARIYPKATRLIEGWSKRISLVEKKEKAPMPFEKKLVLAQCLENVKKAIKIAEATQASDISQFKRFALDVTTVAVPKGIIYDIASVQPIDNRVGMINYVKYLYGSNKGAIHRGDEFTSALKFSGNASGNYSSSDVEGEVLTAAGLSGSETATLSWLPLVKGTLVLDIDGSYYGDDPASGEIKPLVNGVPTGTKIADINYANGLITFVSTATSTNPPVAAYRYDNETVPTQVPELDIRIESMPVTTRSRKLKAIYGLDAAFELYKEYGEDIDAMLIENIASELNHEIDNEASMDLFTKAAANGGNPITWDLTLTPGIGVLDHYESFNVALTHGSNIIYSETKRAMANFMICGVNVATVISSMRNFTKSDIVDPVGPYFLGTLSSGIKVYVNPFYGANDFLLGYKGSSLFDAGYFYCPYMPITTTQLVMMDDFAGRRGWATTYGTKMVNPKLYLKGRITGSIT